ncbi:extracellular solute-binding protein [Candidatus Paracaedibacter symbiosus]|uniref:extracellular solute-binding protein n=1 Tax=Candidatus Paracaedibacter symbiosus TaxID=244582 RepID=UPI00069104EF|nr:extracellular solute-binding protein [Candidatus Paracaedibacter symbiosus]
MEKNGQALRWRKILLFCILILSLPIGMRALFYPTAPSHKEKPYVNVYNWYGMIPAHLVQQFEEETGLTVRYDLYDNNEILEAKLFSGNSGYDVVFPSASPYVQRQIEAGVYQKLDKTLLPNLVHMDSLIFDRMRVADPNLEFAIPYYWGTFGFAYVEEEIKKRLPGAPTHSYRMLFDPTIVSHFSDCGVTLLDEAVDVYPAAMAYLGINPHSDSLEDLTKVQQDLLAIRPFISRFSSSRFVNELVSGESCVAQAWSGEAQLAQQRADEVGKPIHIRYVVPEEGGTMWIDVMAIPKDAPHPKNAHKFINFLLRSEVAAEIANYTQLAVTVKGALPLIEDKIKNDPTIFPKPETLAKLKLDKPQALSYERHRTRLWTQFKIGKVDAHPSEPAPMKTSNIRKG